jgi:hypothetical protein
MIDAGIGAGTRTISNSSLVLPRPPEDLPRGFYDSFAKESKDSAPGLPDLNIGKSYQRDRVSSFVKLSAR